MERNSRVTDWGKQSTVALILSLAVLGSAPTALAGGLATPPPPPVPKPDPRPLPPAKPKPPPVVRHAVTPPPVHHAVVKPAPVAPQPAITPPPTPVIHAPPHNRRAHPRPAPAARPSAAPLLMIDRPSVERLAPASLSTSPPASAYFAGSTSGSGPNWILSLGIFGATLALLLLALAAVPGWVVSSPPVARFLDQHRQDFTFTGFAFLTGVVILSAMVALSGT